MDTNGHEFAKGTSGVAIELVLATRNKHKLYEFQNILGSQFALLDLFEMPQISPICEIGKTFEENAILKAIAVSKERPELSIADDSGLEVNALGGAPGIYSARYAGEKATDARNIEKLLSELHDQNVPVHARSARFRCVIALAKQGKVLGTFEGAVEGQIVEPPRGEAGFGYDPVFQPNGFGQTFAEMSARLKNQISHRAKAIAALRSALSSLEN